MLTLEQQLTSILELMKPPKPFGTLHRVKTITAVVPVGVVLGGLWLLSNESSGVIRIGTIFVVIIFVSNFLRVILFKRIDRQKQAWDRWIGEDGILHIDQNLIARAGNVIREEKRFRDVQDAEEKYGIDVVDVLVLCNAYLQLPRNGGFIRIMKERA